MRTVGKRGAQFTRIARHTTPDLVPQPPETWVITGPRGGRYLAIGKRTRYVGETDDDFTQNTRTVVDYSEDLVYLRPGSRLARETDHNI